MPVAKGQNPNHPIKGSTTKVEPIRSKKAILNIKKLLTPRNHCLFTLGINTAYRANELLSIRISQVRDIQAGDVIELKQSKNQRYRMVTLNRTATQAVRRFVDTHCTDLSDDDFLFFSQRGKVLTVPTVTNLVKGWCASVGLSGNYGSHTLRKTWGYWQYKRGTPLPLLMEAFGHGTQQQTLSYLCIQSEEVKRIYDMEL